MNILVINAGSSSLKYQLFDMSDESVLTKGNVERIGMESAILTHESTCKSDVREVSEILDHTAAVRKVLEMLVHKQHGVLASVEEISAVGHRIVHGGETFINSVIGKRQHGDMIKRMGNGNIDEMMNMMETPKLNK
jgi:acetate kinase